MDAFFNISGFLNSSTIYKSRYGKVQEAKSFSIRAYIIDRYLRLTSQLVLVETIKIQLPLLPNHGEWVRLIGSNPENCTKFWSLNLFYVHTSIVTLNDMCNPILWWRRVELVFHIFALAVILSFHYSRGVVNGAFLLMLVLTTIINRANHYRIDY